jgi:5-methylcytosine-specific restriction protein A
MVWQGDPRTSSSPWRRLRRGILKRDNYTCHVCGQPGADEVDHLVPLSEGGTDHPSNLAAIHRTPCHAAKSSAEGNKARHRYRASRPAEPHPGLLS